MDIEGGPVTDTELMELGRYVLNAAAGAVALGHVSLLENTSYATYPDTRMGQVLHDVVWGAKFAPTGDPTVTEARRRLTVFLWESGWLYASGESAGRFG